MRNLSFFLIFTLLSIIVQTTRTQNNSPEMVYQLVSDAVLLVYAYDKNDYIVNQGSAVVINENGYVITNFHIFLGGVRMELVKNNMIIKHPKIIGADPEKDLLILKIDDGRFTPVKVADSDSLSIGQTVYALGNPYGYENTFSSGIITSIRDNYKDVEGRFIQFTASISPGSSGGALVNIRGELAGITSSSILIGQNMNFAIPVNEFLKVKIIDYEDTVQVNAINSLCLGYSNYRNMSYFIASQHYNNFLAAFPDDINGLILAGESYKARGQYDSAVSMYSRAIELDPSNKKAYCLLGDANTGKTEYSSAIENYGKAINIDSNYFDAFMKRGFTFQNMNNSDTNALMDFNRSLKLNPQCNIIYFFRGKLLLSIGDTGNALNDLCYSISYYDLPDICFERGNIFAKLGRHYEAIMDFTQAINLEPDNDSYYFYRALSYSRVSEHGKAIRDYQQAVMLEPRNSSAYNNMAYEYFHVHDLEQSKFYFNKSLKINHEEFDSYLGLSIVSFAENEMIDCRRFIKNACEMRREVKKGMKGIEALEKSGYSWSREEKDILNKIFKMMGFNYFKETKRHRTAKQRAPALN